MHRALGPGLLEGAYRLCLVRELELREVQTEVPLELGYKGLVVPNSYRVDLLVAQRIVVEVKVVERLLPVHPAPGPSCSRSTLLRVRRAQLLTYLRLSQRHVGFLLNFKVPLMRDGLLRLLQGAPPEEGPSEGTKKDKPTLASKTRAPLGRISVKLRVISV